ncbi:unnamed protein product [Tilletia caries]|nr:unnamed protein product [Tilletia caries]
MIDHGTSYTLYSWPESGNSYKVRLLASLLGIDLNVHDLDFLKQEQKEAWFLKINPKGEVPTLVFPNGKRLTDSAAILTYLAGKEKPQAGYWSADVEEQSDIIQWLAFAASWVQFGVFTARAILSYGGAYNGLGTASDAHLLEEAKVRGHKSLHILDEELSQRD